MAAGLAAGFFSAGFVAGVGCPPPSAGAVCADATETANVKTNAAHTACVYEFIFCLTLLSVFLERELTVVLAEKVQKSLILTLLHVEQASDDLVVATCFL